MLELNFFNILIHILNILCWVGVALWITLGIRWLVRRRHGQRGA
jgi:hypothetical protein